MHLIVGHEEMAAPTLIGCVDKMATARDPVSF